MTDFRKAIENIAAEDSAVGDNCAAAIINAYNYSKTHLRGDPTWDGDDVARVGRIFSIIDEMREPSAPAEQPTEHRGSARMTMVRPIHPGDDTRIAQGIDDALKA